MDVALWAVQIGLALAFLVAGYSHAFDFERAARRPPMAWMHAVGQERMRIIGILEILGAIGLVAPAASRVLPWLTPVAAVGLALVMVGAIVLHIQRREYPNIIINAVLGALALFVAYGRFVLEPIA
ncbi:MAG: DoxX family protein [Chloroflexi bacterium]|nr:DoxX family protein [Chloroflexota bacterium]